MFKEEFGNHFSHLMIYVQRRYCRIDKSYMLSKILRKTFFWLFSEKPSSHDFSREFGVIEKVRLAVDKREWKKVCSPSVVQLRIGDSNHPQGLSWLYKASLCAANYLKSQ